MQETSTVDIGPATAFLFCAWLVLLFLLIGMCSGGIIAALDDVQTACESAADPPLTP